MKRSFLYFVVIILLVIYIIPKQIQIKKLIYQSNFLTNKLHNSKLSSSHWESNFVLNVEFNNVKIKNNNLLSDNTNDKILNILNKDYNLVLFYSNDICSICDDDIFISLYEYSIKEVLNNLIVIVPISSYREFNSINEQFNLNIENIYAYESSFEVLPQDISRGMFLIIDNMLNVHNIFQPSKPINAEWLELYFNLIKKEYFIDVY